MTSRRLRLLWIAGFFLWSLLIVLLGWQDRRSELHMVYDLAKAEAKGNYNKDLVYRRWVAKQGGVYVKESAYTPANPYLSNIPNRDLVLADGTTLTLVNPAYMTRQVYELAEMQFGAKGHITSLKPLRPGNAPDPWEEQALHRFHEGEHEVSAVTTINNQQYLRLMYPMTTEDSCLKCHARQGYQIGDIRGGISVAIPMQPYRQAYAQVIRTHFNSRIIIWLAGSLLLLFSYLFLKSRFNLELQARQRAEISEHKYRMLFNQATIGFALVDAANGEILEYNQALAQMTEWPPEELNGRPQSILHHARQDSPLGEDSFNQEQQDDSATLHEETFITRSGKILPVGLKEKKFSLEGREIIFKVIQDISQQKQNEKILREKEEKYRALLNNQNDAVFLHRYRREGFNPFVEVNAIALERYGYTREELLQLSPQDITSPEEARKYGAAQIRRHLLERKQMIFESVHVKKSGESFPVEINTSVVDLNGEQFLLATARDITERKQAEQTNRQLENQLQQKYKMEAIGLLAGGMAHNFNNNLAIILGNLQLATTKLGNHPHVLQYLENARTGVHRARELVRQIAAYSRQEPQQKRPVQPAAIIQETLSLLQSTMPSTVNFDVSLTEQNFPLTILADPTRIQEALINLCTNAVHAMDEHGDLQLSLRSTELRLQDLPLKSNLTPGRYACVAVSDNGCGMTAETIERIFDPFFTTKGVDEGTGMGLSTVKGIVEQHDGLIRVESEPGKGSTFSLFFPATNDLCEVQQVKEAVPVMRGQEAILIVEDDQMLAELNRTIFEDKGYAVTVEIDSLQALERIRQNPRQFDLILSDQSMPGLTGLELTREAHKINPQLPVVICSGYSSGISPEATRELNIAAFCAKPLEVSELLNVIRQVLDSSSQAG